MNDNGANYLLLQEYFKVWKVSSLLSSHLFFQYSCNDQVCVCVCMHACAAHREDVFWEKGETETEETMPSLPGCIRNVAFSFPGIQHLLYSINLDMMFYFFLIFSLQSFVKDFFFFDVDCFKSLY